MKRKRSYSPRIARNLRACYLRATPEDRVEGLDWYSNARRAAEDLAETFSLPTPAVCGIIAALSPGSLWERNLADARVFCEEWRGGARDRDLPALGTYGFRNVIKAARCAAGEDPLEVLGGDKVRAFYTCIVNPYDESAVCIDRHAKSAAFGRKLTDRESIVSRAEYPWLAAHFRREAAAANLIPSQFQAICWVVWRRLQGNLEQEEIPF